MSHADVPATPRIARPLGAVQTERLDLTPMAAGDAEELAVVFAEPAVWRFPYGRGMDAAWTSAFVERAADHWRQHGFGLWTVRRRTDARVIGYLGLSMPAFLAEIVASQRMPAVEVGWRLHPDAWGQGLASEGARAALTGAFATLELAEVCSAPQTTNPASARVAERIGMRYERVARLEATATRGAVEADLYWISAVQWRSAADRSG